VRASSDKANMVNLIIDWTFYIGAKRWKQYIDSDPRKTDRRIVQIISRFTRSASRLSSIRRVDSGLQFEQDRPDAYRLCLGIRAVH
jgi:hypothetical protein